MRSDTLWVILASVAPLVLGAAVPFALIWARGHKLKAEEAQQEVLGLKKTLTDAQKFELLGSMVAGLVHDLNNIHMAISGNLDLVLLFDTTLKPETRQGIVTARTTAEKGTEIIRSVLSFSRHDLKTQCVDIEKTLRETEGILRLMLPKGVRLAVLLPPPPAFVVINKVHLFQIIMNLVVNARDALGEKGGNIVVSVDLDDKDMVLKVQDDGCGIPPDVLPRIFGWSFTTKGEGKGSGLGLSIVRESVNRLGGTVAVASEVGQGTTFTVTVPRG